mmetsp:Transcript_10563/g.30669  ORF Transcript_10563/g.30669 Transcript_10563/m.30669 type:complete len:272 (-) Transcript_10563:1221-2036(-)
MPQRVHDAIDRRSLLGVELEAHAAEVRGLLTPRRLRGYWYWREFPGLERLVHQCGQPRAGRAAVGNLACHHNEQQPPEAEDVDGRRRSEVSERQLRGRPRDAESEVPRVGAEHPRESEVDEFRPRPVLNDHISRLQVPMHHRGLQRVQVAQCGAELEGHLEPRQGPARVAASEAVQARSGDELVDEGDGAELLVEGGAKEGGDARVASSPEGADLGAERLEAVRVAQRLRCDRLAVQPGCDDHAETALAQDPHGTRRLHVGPVDPPVLLAA